MAAGLIGLACACACVLPAVLAQGPLTCGLFACAFGNLRGRPVETGALKRGWDVLGSAAGAALCILLLQMIPMFLLVLVLLGIFAALAASFPPARGQPPDASMVLALAGIFTVEMVGTLVTMIWILWIGTRTMFVLPLITDRGYGATDALGESWRVTRDRFWELLLLNFLGGLIGGLGIYACYVGVIFTLPLYFLIVAAAYEDRFGVESALPSEAPLR